MNRKFVLAGTVPLIIAASLAGCATRGADAGSTREVRTGNTCDTKGDSQGIEDDTIKIGMFTPLSGPVADTGKAALAGYQVALDEFNAAGGVDGKKVKLITQDDRYDAGTAQQAVRKLNTSDQVFALSGGLGTPNFVATLPYIKQERIPAVGPYAPSNQVGVMQNPDVFMIWPNFTSEFKVAMGWVLKNKSPKSVSFVQLEGDVGDDAQKGLEEALKGSGISIGTNQTMQADQTDFSSIAQALKSEGSEWVAMVGPTNNLGQIIQAMNKIGYNPNILGPSDMTDDVWLNQFAKDAQGAIVATKVTPLNSDDPEVQKFVKSFTDATGRAPGVWNAVGYTQAEVTFEALKSAKALTRDCYELALEQMTDYTTGLIPPVTFGADSRQGTNAVGVGEVDGDQIREVAPFQPVN